MGRNLDTLAAGLFEARQRADALAWPDGVEVANAEDAYRVQDVLLVQYGDIGGWKLFAQPDPADSRCSPIPSSQVLASPAALELASFIAPKVEVEIAVRIGSDLPPRERPYTEDEVCAAIGALHASFEILDSRYADTGSRSMAERLADLQTNGAIIYGDQLENWRGLVFEQARMSLLVNGHLSVVAEGGPLTSTTLQGLTWLANHATRRVGGLRTGQIIITGAPNMPAVAIRQASTLEGLVEGIGRVKMDLH